MSEKVVSLLGAGASVADVATRSLKARPPLDERFFSVAASVNSGDSRLTTVRDYFKRTYNLDICRGEYDSMERVMAALYPDLFNKSLTNTAWPAFQALLQLFTGRLASTTNDLRPTQKRLLYRMLTHYMAAGVDPCDITIITFNQDVQVEKTLQHLGSVKRWERFSEKLFSFPGIYAIPVKQWERVTSPKGDADCFPESDITKCLHVLKLHGSLNWYSTHTSSRPSRSAMLNTGRKLSVTRRRTIAPDMKLEGKRSVYTLPVVVPPVTHKSSVLPDALGPVWERAEKCLVDADQVVVFGYSCPALDFESANLLRRSQERRSNAARFTVIDPNGDVVTRYISLLELKRLSYYADGHQYVAAMDAGLHGISPNKT